MMTDVMISEGGLGNHPSSAWALKTAAQIFDVRETPPDRQLAAHMVQNKIAEVLESHFESAMAKEADNLGHSADHCDTPLEVQNIAASAIQNVVEAASGSLWDAMLQNPQWVQAAILAVGHMLASAMHIERLLYADNHPTNAVATAYKFRHVGT